jgi:hypothetical protein
VTDTADHGDSEDRYTFGLPDPEATGHGWRENPSN